MWNIKNIIDKIPFKLNVNEMVISYGNIIKIMSDEIIDKQIS